MITAFEDGEQYKNTKHPGQTLFCYGVAQITDDDIVLIAGWVDDETNVTGDVVEEIVLKSDLGTWTKVK